MKWINGGVLAGGAILLLIFLSSNLLIKDYRSILTDPANENFNLILLDFNKMDKLELLARSDDPNIEFIRYKYEGDRIKVFQGRSLIDESYWQIFEGSKGVFFNEKNPITVESDSEKARVVFNITYFFDSRHTNPAGQFIREIEVFPHTNKETIYWEPVDPNRRFNLRWFHLTKIKNQKRSLNDVDEIDSDTYQISWKDSRSMVSAARIFDNGKVRIIYKSAKGRQIIDPKLTIGTYVVDVRKISNTDQCLTDCKLELEFTINKDTAFGRVNPINFSFERMIGSDVIENVGVSISEVRKVTRTVSSPRFITQRLCSGRFPNGTSICTTERIQQGTISRNETVNRLTPINARGFIADKSKTYRMTLTGRRDASIGHKAIDVIPEIGWVKLRQFDWWNSSWGSRRNITINNTAMAVLTENYSVNLTINTSGPAYLDSGNDTRIVLNNAHELERVNLTPWNSSNTEIFFKLNGSINPGIKNTSYTVYFNNSDAVEPPQNASRVFPYYQDFATEEVIDDLNGKDGWFDPGGAANCPGAVCFNVTKFGVSSVTGAHKIRVTSANQDRTIRRSIPDMRNLTFIGYMQKDTGAGSDGSPSIEFYVSNGSQTLRFGIDIGSAENISYFDSNGWNGLAPYVPSVWYKYIVDINDEGFFNLTVYNTSDGNLVGTVANKKTRTNMSEGVNNITLNFQDQGGFGETSYWDWFIYREGANTQPDISLDLKEDNPPNSTNEPFYINLTLNGQFNDRFYELGSNATIFANVTDASGIITSKPICISFDITNGTNYTCESDGTIELNFTTFTSQIRFNDSDTEKSLTSNTIVYFDLHNQSQIINATLNISGSQSSGNFPKNVRIDTGFDNITDFEIFGTIRSDRTTIDQFSDGLTEKNLTFSTRLSHVFNIEMNTNKTFLNNVTMNISGVNFYIEEITATENLTVNNGSNYIMNGTFTFDQVRFGGSNTKLSCANGGFIEIKANSIIINDTVKIDCDKTGYEGGVGGRGSIDCSYIQSDPGVEGSGPGKGSNGTRGASSAGAGGSGHRVIGGAGGNSPSGSGGAGGSAYDTNSGNDSISLFSLGSGAGGGGGGQGNAIGVCNVGGTGGTGERGGGAIRLRAKEINISGNITAIGGKGGNGGGGSCESSNDPSDSGGGGGGASGGLVLISGDSVNITHLVVNVSGGAGGIPGDACGGGTSGSPGSSGSSGMIKIFSTTVLDNNSVTIEPSNSVTYGGPDAFPSNISFDIGVDGVIDVFIDGSINTTNSSISVNLGAFPWEQYSNGSCQPFACTVPVSISSRTLGRLTMNDLNVTYIVPKIDLNVTRIIEFLNETPNHLDVPLNITSDQYGTVNLQGLDIDYFGSRNITVNATSGTITKSLAMNITWSNFSIGLPYSFTNDLIWLPGSNSSKNVTPFGQSSTTPIYNFSTFSYDQPFNISVRLKELPNQSACFNLTISPTSNKNDAGSIVINDSFQQIHSNINTTSGINNRSKSGFLFADLDNCNPRVLDFNLTVISACSSCVRSIYDINPNKTLGGL